MFSNSQISNWLPNFVDPIAIEDWFANREVFGKVEKMDQQDAALELAYMIQLAKEGKLEGNTKDWPLFVILNGTNVSGLIDGSDYLLVIPTGKFNLGKVAFEAEFQESGMAPNQVKVVAGDFLTLTTTKSKTIDLKIRMHDGVKINGKTEINWSGSGKTKIVFDSRGRPTMQMSAEKQRAIISKMLEQLQ